MEAGHNSQHLRTIIERIETVEGEIKDLAEGRKEIYQEAKSNGYDLKALKAIVSRRRQDPKKLAEHETIVDSYSAALGA